MTASDPCARSRKSLVPFAFGVAALLAATAATAQVDPGADSIDASGNYQHEVQSCLSGKTQQDQATCLKEARNARADKKRGLLDNAGGRFESNAAARCDVLAGDEKAACQARMLGYGSVSGSVAGGGLLRELETVVVPADTGPAAIEPQTSDPAMPEPSSK